MTTNLTTTANRVIYFSIRNQKAAESLAKHLIKSSNDSIILPFIDFPGPISKEILSRKFKSLTVCERDAELRQRFHVSLPPYHYNPLEENQLAESNHTIFHHLKGILQAQVS